MGLGCCGRALNSFSWLLPNRRGASPIVMVELQPTGFELAAMVRETMLVAKQC